MKRYRAEITITADGVPLQAGDVFDEDEVEAGCLVSMLRLRQCVEVADPPPGGVRLPAGTTVEQLPAEPVEAVAQAPAIGPAKPPTLKAKK